MKTQETLNGTRSLTQQDIQTPSHFVDEEAVELISVATQQNNFPTHPTPATPHNPNNTPFPLTKLQ